MKRNTTYKLTTAQEADKAKLDADKARYDKSVADYNKRQSAKAAAESKMKDKVQE